MEPSILLLLYAVAAGTLIDRWLTNTDWAVRRPSTALVMWHWTALSVIAALLGALYLLAHDISEHSLARLLHADKGVLHDIYGPPQEASGLWNIAAIGAVTLLVTLISRATIAHCSARRTAFKHRVAVAKSRCSQLGAHQDQDQDRDQDARITKQVVSTHRVNIIDSQVPVVYCLAAGPRRDRILVTSGAIDLLPHPLLAAAVAHEEAHLDRHHHVQVTAARATRATTWRLGLLRHYADQVTRLVELDADDVAAKTHGSRKVAAALLELSQPRGVSVNGAHSAPGLAMAAADPGARIRRLLQSEAAAPSIATVTVWPTARLAARVRCAASVILVAVVALMPLVAALAPALAATGTAPDHGSQIPASVRNGFVHHP